MFFNDDVDVVAMAAAWVVVAVHTCDEFYVSMGSKRVPVVSCRVTLPIYNKKMTRLVCITEDASGFCSRVFLSFIQQDVLQSIKLSSVGLD
jgi:hypothetical protein